MDLEIEYSLKDRPHLHYIENDVYRINERIKGIDNKAFIVFNTEKNQYELHSLDSFFLNPKIRARATTYQATLNYEYLDERVLKFMHMNSLDKFGYELIEDVTRESRLREEQMKARGKMRIQKATRRIEETYHRRNRFI